MRTAHMGDAVTITDIPTDMPYVAVYINGRYAADLAQVKERWPHSRIFEIDVLGTSPDASIKDRESEDIPVDEVIRITTERYNAHPDALTRWYMSLDNWSPVKAQVAKLDSKIQRTVRYWVADWTGQAHIVKGADATQYANGDYDQSLINVGTFV